jgi:hypothetical protein
MAMELLSPELALVDPELAARARASLPNRPWPASRRAIVAAPAPTAVPAPAPSEHAYPRRAYPVWARVTAALWLVVIGILIGGAAIPHAQDRPRVVPPEEDVPASMCPRSPQAPATPEP